MSWLSVTLLLYVLAVSMESFADEEELYRALREGDQDAFRIFYEKHFDNLFLFLRNRNISPDVAKDLIQKAFVYIWENRNSIDPKKSLKSYLFRIAYTRMLNHLDARKETVQPEDALSDVAVEPRNRAEYNDLYSALKAVIRSMPEKRRAVFESCFIQQLTYKETAEFLSVSVKTVETHMSLALKDVREALEIFKET